MQIKKDNKLNQNTVKNSLHNCSVFLEAMLFLFWVHNDAQRCGTELKQCKEAPLSRCLTSLGMN